jgi:hypothetical protein
LAPDEEDDSSNLEDSDIEEAPTGWSLTKSNFLDKTKISGR